MNVTPARSPRAAVRRLSATLHCYAFLDEFVLFYPVYVLLFVDTGLSVVEISTLFILWSGTGILLEVPSGVLADAVSRRLLLVVGPLCAAAGFGLWAAAPSYWAFAGGFVLWGAKGTFLSGALEALVPPNDPKTSRLWYDARDIPFLREDAGDEAKTFFTQVQAARHLTDGGWDPDAAIQAAKAADISLLLGKHSGLLSVQLHDPTAAPEPPAGSDGASLPPTLDLVSSSNGNGRPLAQTGR
jgi:hypothetical protein